MIGCELNYRYKQFFESKVLFGAALVIWPFVFHRFHSNGGFFDDTEGYPSTSMVGVYWPLLEGAFYAVITASYLGVTLPIPKFLDKWLAWLDALSYSV
jgi:hypothetical protein